MDETGEMKVEFLEDLVCSYYEIANGRVNEARNLPFEAHFIDRADLWLIDDLVP